MKKSKEKAWNFAYNSVSQFFISLFASWTSKNPLSLDKKYLDSFSWWRIDRLIWQKDTPVSAVHGFLVLPHHHPHFELVWQLPKFNSNYIISHHHNPMILPYIMTITMIWNTDQSKLLPCTKRIGSWIHFCEKLCQFCGKGDVCQVDDIETRH